MARRPSRTPARRNPGPPRFDAKWNRRRARQRRLGDWWRSARWLLLVAAIVLAWRMLESTIGPPRSWTQSDVRVGVCGEGRSAVCALDGDTLAIGFGPQGRRIRLTGFDAPERDGACPAESAKAEEATRALVRWLNAGPFEWDGGADPPRDRYGRELRSVRRTGADGRMRLLADHMVEAGLAEGSGWAASAIDWCRT